MTNKKTEILGAKEIEAALRNIGPMIQGKKGYRPKQAHTTTMDRRRHAQKFIKLTPPTITLIASLIQQDFSPEQVSGFLKRNHSIRISHETIYQYVLSDKANGGTLYQHLRRSNKKRKKRYGSNDRRGQIRGRVSIDERPAIVNAKQRIGDWEIDTIIGKNHKGVLLTAVERKSKFTLIKKLANKKADRMANATVNLLGPYQKKVFTIASDKDKVFANND